jgi:DNA polymerase-1
MKLLIIDLMNLAFRAYHGFARQAYLTHNGKPTFMVYGVAVAINKLLNEIRPTHVAVAAEGGGKTFRHELFENYKTGRKERPNDFDPQLADVHSLIAAYGFKTVKVPKVEADDIVGTLCEKFQDIEIFIFSGDKDFMQLVNDKVSIVRHSQEGYDIIKAEGVFSKFGCLPSQVVDALAIIGDAADAIPGVKGIGEKGASQLLAAFGDLDSIYSNLDKIKPALANKLAKSQESAYLSQKLAKIDKNVSIDVTLDDLKIANPFDRAELRDFFTSVNFKSMLSKDNSGMIDPKDLEVLDIESLL